MIAVSIYSSTAEYWELLKWLFKMENTSQLQLRMADTEVGFVASYCPLAKPEVPRTRDYNYYS